MIAKVAPRNNNDVKQLSATMITVARLIAHLQTLPQTAPVAYRLHSEQILMELKDIHVKKLCKEREDGWVHDARPDKPTQTYVVFPGN